MEESLFDRVSGDSGIAKVVEEFSKRALDDPRIKNRFNGLDVDELKKSACAVVADLLKSSQPYASGPLAEGFRGKGITKHEFNLVLNILEESLKEQNLTSHTVQQVTEILGAARIDIEGL
jgi:hemoglobin